MKRKVPPCIKCEHYYVTYDQRFPRGCRLFEIKSRMLPTYAVFRSTGQHCPAYQLKAKSKGDQI